MNYEPPFLDPRRASIIVRQAGINLQWAFEIGLPQSSSIQLGKSL